MASQSSLFALFFAFALARWCVALQLRLVHLNDVHSHFMPFTDLGTFCTDSSSTCFGGFGRISSVLQQYTNTSSPYLVVDAGDIFQGTLFFNFYHGNASALLMNRLNFSVGTIGNHEFDIGEEMLARYLSKLTYPIVCANIQFAAGTPLHGSPVTPYQIVTVEDRRIAFIGVITEELPELAILSEYVKILDIVMTLNSLAPHLIASGAADYVVVLSHAGIERDLEIAAQTRSISLIIGGHSHTRMQEPISVTNLEHAKTWVFQDWCWGRTVGVLDLSWVDNSPYLRSITGFPVPVDDSVEPDACMDAMVNELKQPLDNFLKSPVGSAAVDLDGATCRNQECVLGDVITDAMRMLSKAPQGPAISLHGKTCRVSRMLGCVPSDLHGASTSSFDAVIAATNGGSVRASLGRGTISLGDVMTVFPFTNSILGLIINESVLWDVLQFSASRRNRGSFLQVSNIVAKIDEDTGRLLSFEIPSIPGRRFTELDHARSTTFLLIITDYLARGGDGYNMLSEGFDTIDFGFIMSDVMLQYLEKFSPVAHPPAGRISFVHQSNDESHNDDVGGDENWASESVLLLIIGIAVGCLVLVVGAIFVYRRATREKRASKYQRALDANAPEWADDM
eukprot:ANDGO_02869.mRNA.1 Protein 5NUC